ncbi:MAG: cellulose synthase family protein [Planctomycetota bacterium]|jgi:cellulose synthase/poly-beta-1,6-N-acetylglucosamine synthase-like glycosyltransferase
MDALAPTLLTYYVAAIAVLCLYGLHRYWLVTVAVRHRNDAPEPAARFDELPRVTIQLPMFNEPNVAQRLVEAAAAIDYPHDRMQIQVLDDSTDDTTAIVGECCRRLAETGIDIEHLHRTDRVGYKAGALGVGLASATGDLVAVFDADFLPPTDFLDNTVHHFTDESIGMVQTRWSHLNRDESMLTRIQAMSLDAHFLIEQQARAATGRWFNFNGTAGIWRRVCIDEAGGWEHDTLTEDTDLSYRAQLAGWRFRFLPQVTCPAELPPTIGALLGQQHRWNKGLVQTAIKLLPRILTSRASLGTKVEAWFHLTAPLPYVFILLLALIALPALFVHLPVYGAVGLTALGAGFACLVLGTMAACTFYIVSQRRQGLGILATLALLPVLMAIGVGLSVINTKAVLEALFGNKSPFVRTPKFAGHANSAADPIAPKRRSILPRGSIEILLGAAMFVAIAIASREPFTLIGAPFLVLFALGFFAVGLPLIRAATSRPMP